MHGPINIKFNVSYDRPISLSLLAADRKPVRYIKDMVAYQTTDSSASLWTFTPSARHLYQDLLARDTIRTRKTEARRADTDVSDS
jgi:hypothetical protein